MEGFTKRYTDLPIKEIWLPDVPAGKEKQDIIAAMPQKMWNASGHNVKIHSTLDWTEALKNADFVTTQFRVEQLSTRILAQAIPASYGLLGQETKGPREIFKALRTIPVILAIIEDMK